MKHTVKNYKNFLIDNVLDEENFLELNKALTGQDAGWEWKFPYGETEGDSIYEESNGLVAYHSYVWNTYQLMLKDIIWKVKPKFDKLAEEHFNKDIGLYTIHATGKTAGQKGGIHRDTILGHEGETISEDIYVLMYYPNKVWKAEWDGVTNVYDDNYEIIDSVLPYPNRVFGFDANFYHQGGASSLACQELRMCIMFKYCKKEYADRSLKRTIEWLEQR